MVNFQTTTIGIIYQAFFLINSISVIDNVVLPQTFHGIQPGKRRAWGKKILKRFEMDIHAEKYPDNLSGGQSQRVSVSRAMVNNPEIILADEPTGNLDSVSTKQVMESLAEINSKDKKTVIIITHNAAQLSYAHRVFYMKDGKLQRTVPNPDKKQIAKIDKQKILVTEMDQLSKLFPYDSPVSLKVKSIVNYLTQSMNFDQLVRLEEFTSLVVERKVSKREYAKMMSQKYHKGGVGISPNLAAVMSDKVEKILKQAEDARRFRRRFAANNFFDREKKLISNLTKFLIEEHNGELNLTQKRRLKELVYNRIAGLSRRNDFEDHLRTSVEGGGIGLSRKPARDMTFYFEKILIQGNETKLHGH